MNLPSHIGLDQHVKITMKNGDVRVGIVRDIFGNFTLILNHDEIAIEDMKSIYVYKSRTKQFYVSLLS